MLAEDVNASDAAGFGGELSFRTAVKFLECL